VRLRKTWAAGANLQVALLNDVPLSRLLDIYYDIVVMKGQSESHVSKRIALGAETEMFVLDISRGHELKSSSKMVEFLVICTVDW